MEGCTYKENSTDTESGQTLNSIHREKPDHAFQQPFNDNPMRLLSNEINKGNDACNISVTPEKQHFDINYSNPRNPITIFSDQIIANLKTTHEGGAFTLYRQRKY
uniref:Uncharacterized protein n=1 Tax=Glossina pallidipes TaxID=7398 RepID=A0A1B0AFS2_GLOPL